MLDKAIKIVAYFFGALLTVIGMRWLVDPAGAADSLGMELLDGAARSTQLGDLTAFFLVSGGCAILGLIKGNKTLLGVAAALMGLTAVFRTVAYLVHGADFATEAIVLEVIMFAAFMLARQRLTTPAV